MTILSRVVRGADAEGKMFVRKVDAGCSNFLLALLKERIQGAPILMTRKRQKLRSAKVTLSPNPTLAPSLSLSLSLTLTLSLTHPNPKPNSP